MSGGWEQILFIFASSDSSMAFGESTKIFSGQWLVLKVSLRRYLGESFQSADGDSEFKLRGKSSIVMCRFESCVHGSDKDTEYKDRRKGTEMLGSRTIWRQRTGWGGVRRGLARLKRKKRKLYHSLACGNHRK
jgi:hypothetical protein